MQRKALSLGALVCALAMPAAEARAQLTLNVTSWVPHSHHLVAGVTMPFCKDVEAATQARVKCNLLPKSVVAAPQTFDAVREGLADLSFTVHGYTPGRFALTDVAEFPFLGDTSEAVSIAYQRIHDRMLAKYDEHKGVHLLAVFTHGPGQIFNTKRAVTSLKDLEGMKIRVGGGLVNDVAKAIGTVPMLKPAPESYEYVPGGLYNVTFAMVMNEGKWKQISEADKAAINKLSGEALARRAGKSWDAVDTHGEKVMREANIPIVTASPQFVAEIKARTQGLEKIWIDKVKAKGFDGAAALAALRAEIAKAGM
jgi:TRAP-type C4-dicarboxylate transport system substrate-binding protein